MVLWLVNCCLLVGNRIPVEPIDYLPPNIYLYWLVVSTPLKNISQWERLSHILWKNKKCSKPPTSNLYMCMFKQKHTTCFSISYPKTSHQLCWSRKNHRVKPLRYHDFDPSHFQNIVLWLICVYIYILVGGLNPSEKYESQLGWLFPIYGKNVTNHQPVYNYIHLLVKPLKYPRYPLDSYPQILLVQREKHLPISNHLDIIEILISSPVPFGYLTAKWNLTIIVSW